MLLFSAKDDVGRGVCDD